LKVKTYYKVIEKGKSHVRLEIEEKHK